MEKMHLFLGTKIIKFLCSAHCTHTLIAQFVAFLVFWGIRSLIRFFKFCGRHSICKSIITTICGLLLKIKSELNLNLLNDNLAFLQKKD